MLERTGRPEGAQVRPDHDELLRGLRLVAIAAISALATATLVVGVGRSFLPHHGASPPAAPDLTLAAAR